MNKQRTPVVRSIDAGYGLTKSTLDVKSDGTIVCGHFASLAVSSDPQTMRSLNIRQRNTVDVTVDGAQFEVGPDILLAQTGNDVGREIGENWTQAPNYKAVMLGALHYMNQEIIDLLVLGLPVNQYLSEERINRLRDAYKGTHSLPNGKSVEVKDVWVRPQPFGGYMDMGDHLDELNALIAAKSKKHMDEEGVDIGFAAIDSAHELMTNHCILVVDPGEYTLDWLLVDRGAINTKASGAASDSGRHRVVNDVVRVLSQDLGRDIPPANLSRINDALRTGSVLKLGGKVVDLKKYETVVAQSVLDPISRLLEGLRGLEDRIDLILLVGGHPAIYEAELAKRFPYTPIFQPPESLYANVRGFQRAGEAKIATGS
jgi:plasmid segregation protein ParM